MVRGGGRSQPLDHHRLPVAVARASKLHGLSDFGRKKEKWPDGSGHVTREAHGWNDQDPYPFTSTLL